MPITVAQTAQADRQQFTAASDPSLHIRLFAGPGTGKSKTIIKRIFNLLSNGATPSNIYVISFTRATCSELKDRISQASRGTQFVLQASQVRVSTMHSLALKILRQANLLNSYPADPSMMDEWEQSSLYDAELANFIPCTATRAGEIRRAYDTQWQTLNPAFVNQIQISPGNMASFLAFHGSRTNLYSCVLPGEVVFKCVEAFRMGSIGVNQMPKIEHLIVDEYQDLNACDQEFVTHLTSGGASLFVAGDDDQSIYSFRHANPSGIVHFNQTYPAAITHNLTDCFRCAPSILCAADNLVQYNPNRINKNLIPLYNNAAPPIQGIVHVWSFQDAQTEAASIAASCDELINAGMMGNEDDILILISNRKLQLEILKIELDNRRIPYQLPSGEVFADDPVIRIILSLLRFCNEQQKGVDDYMAYRTMLGLLRGVGPGTVRSIADDCIVHMQNFRALFDLNPLPHWLAGRSLSAISNVITIAQSAKTWSLTDTLAMRITDITTILATYFISTAMVGQAMVAWNSLYLGLPQQMNLDELLQLLSADNEKNQQAIIEKVNIRLNVPQQPIAAGRKKIQILTMHGAKGLSGKVVFIPSCEQQIMPSTRALHAAGLLIEQRRLFYVSLTRARAACILSHASFHTVAQSFVINQRQTIPMVRSQFLNEANIPSVARANGLTPAEAAVILNDINNL
jgi:DNA helicase II / ATP-dependent DNA helicase PcrA